MFNIPTFTYVRSSGTYNTSKIAEKNEFSAKSNRTSYLDISKFLGKCQVSFELVLYERFVDEMFLSLTSKNYELLLKNF